MRRIAEAWDRHYFTGAKQDVWYLKGAKQLAFITHVGGFLCLPGHDSQERPVSCQPPLPVSATSPCQSDGVDGTLPN